MKRGAPLQRSTPLRRGAPLSSSPPSRTRPPKRASAGPKRDWRNARAKVEREGNACRVCGRVPGQGGVIRVEAAHVIGREHDRKTTRIGFDLWVNPQDVVPLCLRVDGGCHMDYDARRLDLLPHLSRVEQARAVELVGIAAAYRRTTGRREA